MFRRGGKMISTILFKRINPLVARGRKLVNSLGQALRDLPDEDISLKQKLNNYIINEAINKESNNQAVNDLRQAGISI